jgi:hypothetical protein
MENKPRDKSDSDIAEFIEVVKPLELDRSGFKPIGDTIAEIVARLERKRA